MCKNQYLALLSMCTFDPYTVIVCVSHSNEQTNKLDLELHGKVHQLLMMIQSFLAEIII